MANFKCNGSAAFDAADFVGPVVGDYDTPATIERGAVVQRNAMGQFLAALFGSKPAELFILVWLLGEKASKWFHGIDDAVAYVERHAGEDVYAGVALAPADLGPKNRCKAADTAGIVGIWLDLDYQSEAHKKDNLPPTLQATLDLIPQDLPPSIVVHSGHGVQVWWLFPDPWLFTDEADRGAAADLVHSFQALIKDCASRNGWDVDSVFDLARVMRVPGTTNTKVQGDFRPVELLEINDRRYEPQAIRDYLARAGVVPTPPAADRLPGPRNSALEALAGWPWLRKVMQRMPAQLREQKLSRTAWVLGFNTQGQVVHNLQDPSGSYGPVTSVTETNGRLYFGSIGKAAIGWAKAPQILLTPGSANLISHKATSGQRRPTLTSFRVAGDQGAIWKSSIEPLLRGAGLVRPWRLRTMESSK